MSAVQLYMSIVHLISWSQITEIQALQTMSRSGDKGMSN